MSFREVSASLLHPCHIGGFGFYPISATLLLSYAISPAITPSSFLILAAITWALVLVHELGHAAAARMSGFTVVRMAVYPIYGTTRIHRPAARKESFGWLVTVIAGPAAGAAVSLIALAALAELRVTAPPPWIFDGPALEGILVAGLVDQVINLLPLHRVLDGARARTEIARLRALRVTDTRVRRLRHAAAMTIHVPPSEIEAAPATRRAA